MIVVHKRTIVNILGWITWIIYTYYIPELYYSCSEGTYKFYFASFNGSLLWISYNTLKYNIYRNLGGENITHFRKVTFFYRTDDFF